MLVVADASPLIVLVNIGHVDVLPRLFVQVFIPPAISLELKQSNRPPAVRGFIANPPDWLVERVPQNIESIPALDAGENAAISLAKEIHADLLLIDESRGRKAALSRNIRITGTLGVLETAAANGFLDLAEAFHRIKHTDFWISHELLDERLRIFLSQRKT